MTEAELFLKQWHARHAGGSAVVFGNARDAAGRTSYQRLAAVVDDGVDALDLACGDGFLLEAIAAAAPRTRLTGVDMSEDELAAAARRLPHVPLIEARAQVLPFEDASFDIVTCHMAFMLMDDVDGVLSEVRRVLRPGGSFAAVVGSDDRAPWVADVFRALKELRLRLEIPWSPTLGDERVRGPQALRALIEGAGFTGFAYEVAETFVTVPRAGLGPFLAEAYYGLDELPPGAMAVVLNDLELPDPVAWPFPVLQFVARRA